MRAYREEHCEVTAIGEVVGLTRAETRSCCARSGAPALLHRRRTAPARPRPPSRRSRTVSGRRPCTRGWRAAGWPPRTPGTGPRGRSPGRRARLAEQREFVQADRDARIGVRRGGRGDDGGTASGAASSDSRRACQHRARRAPRRRCRRRGLARRRQLLLERASSRTRRIQSGRDAARSGCRSVDPLAEFRTRLARLPKQSTPWRRAGRCSAGVHRACRRHRRTVRQHAPPRHWAPPVADMSMSAPSQAMELLARGSIRRGMSARVTEELAQTMDDARHARGVAEAGLLIKSGRMAGCSDTTSTAAQSRTLRSSPSCPRALCRRRGTRR
jgi:hypothetical protein